MDGLWLAAALVGAAALLAAVVASEADQLAGTRSTGRFRLRRGRRRAIRSFAAAACGVADAGATTVTGRLVLRPLATDSGVPGSGVEVRVDVHAAGRGSKHASRAMRSATRAGLRRWAAGRVAT
jgi:hypothetical protein